MFRVLPLLLLLSFLFLMAVSSVHSEERIEATPPGMVLVPAGAFQMGAAEGYADERPVHRVELPAFFLDRTEVTVEEYGRFVTATGHAAPPDWSEGKPDPKRLHLPVVNVSWLDAAEYARWAGKRLPTEAEWERAARGTDNRRLPWGDAWREGLANVPTREDQNLRPVGSYAQGASPCGALDLIGNAWEWTADWYQPYPGNALPSIHYGQKYRAVRGEGCIGFYNSPPLNTHTATLRARFQPFGRYDSLGFRCARDLQPRAAPQSAPRAHSAEKPTPPRVETSAQVAARYAGGVAVRLSGPVGSIATFGLPLPEGIVKDVASLRAEGPILARRLATWRDGTVRWALIDLPVPANRVRTIRWDGQGKLPAPHHPVTVQETGNMVTVNTGVAKVTFRSGERDWLRLKTEQGELTGSGEQVLATEPDGKPVTLRTEPPTRITLEDRGPLRARVRVEGWMVEGDGARVLRYRYRLELRAGSASVGLTHTFTHLGTRKLLLLRDYRLAFASPSAAGRGLIGVDGRAVPVGAAARVEQSSPAVCRLEEGKRASRTAYRADGWVCGPRFLVAVQDFWQQYPKALTREPTGQSSHW